MTVVLLLACGRPGLVDEPRSTEPQGWNGGAPSLSAHDKQAIAWTGAAPQPIAVARVSPHVQELPQQVLWGDPHSHSNLSADGCESSEQDCTARVVGDPANGIAERAAGNGLDWFALTDHVEFGEYVDLASGERIEVWDRTLEHAARAPAQHGVVLYPGYEWRDCSEAGTHHRTVVFEARDACETLRPPACPGVRSPKAGFGHEGYVRRSDNGELDARELEEHLRLSTERPGCTSRWIAFAHHSAYSRPGSVDWSQSKDRMENELLVEIFSEHGSSECVDLSKPGCDYYVNADHYAPEGSVQAALAAGVRLGFVAGTDSHDSNPGSLQDGPGAVTQTRSEGGKVISDVAYHPAPGGVTAVLLLPGVPPYEQAVFDGLTARNTVASTTTLDGLQLWVQDPMGQVFLPGDALPVGTYHLNLTLPFDFEAELVDPQGDAEPVVDWFTVQSGPPRYLRVRFEVDDEAHRLWASPFFPAD